MGSIKHEIVGDRVIHGEGTSTASWQACGVLQQLPEMAITALIPANARVCIVAPHPDDEILGCGGLIQRLDQLGYHIELFAVTNGTASHPSSSIYTPEQLNHIRPAESMQALHTLKLKESVKRTALDIQDGQVALQRDLLKQRLKAHLTAQDVLITTFEQDGHPDHEITGQVVQGLAKELGLNCIQVLIWAWHWAKPEDARIDWTKAHKLNLTEDELRHKRQAASCFNSQLEADPSTGQAAIISKTALERILQAWEVYLYE